MLFLCPFYKGFRAVLGPFYKDSVLCWILSIRIPCCFGSFYKDSVLFWILSIRGSVLFWVLFIRIACCFGSFL